MRTHLVLLCLVLSGLLLSLGCLGFGESPTAAAPAYNASKAPPVTTPVNNTPLPNATPPQPPVISAAFEMSFINLSMADATLIHTKERTILFDAGSAESAPKLVSYLHSKGIDKIDVLILSSNDPAYVGGAPEILRQFTVSEVWTNGGTYSDALWGSIQDLLGPSSSRSVVYGYNRTWGDLEVTVLNPQTSRLSGEGDATVIKVSYGSFCSLLFSNSLAAGASSADAGTVVGGVDSRIITGPVPVNCPVLRVSHHGSANVASFQLLNKMNPSDAIISVGPNPPQDLYPAPALIRRLILNNVTVWTTDKLGTVTVTSDGTTYSMRSDKPRDTKYGKFLENVIYNGASYWQTTTTTRR